MDTLMARPHILKQANLSLIRKSIKLKGTATRAEIAHETKISFTTVRSLLAEMIENGEIVSIGHDESSGGRKAERYSLKPDRYYSAAFCIMDKQIHGLLVNACGEIVEITELDVLRNEIEESIVSFLDIVMQTKEIKSIGLGVPGAVEGGGYWKKKEHSEELYKVDIGDALAERYGIPVVLENDLNATAIGFERCYEREFPWEKPENINMAYLHFEKGCVSAGFIAGGRIIHGCNHFAGELGLIPMDNGGLLDEHMSRPMDDARYVALVIRIISWICGILNPQYIALAGPDLRKDCIALIGDGLSAQLPKHMAADLLYSADVWHDYHDGMAYLAAGKMFDDVQFIKE